MSMTGNWVLHFGWGSPDSYSQTNVTFNNNGTFSGPGTGQWRKQDGTLMLSFDGGPAKYGGTVDGNVGSGAMSTFAGMNGCWYLVKQGTTGMRGETATPSHDALGNHL